MIAQVGTFLVVHGILCLCPALGVEKERKTPQKSKKKISRKIEEKRREEKGRRLGKGWEMEMEMPITFRACQGYVRYATVCC